MSDIVETLDGFDPNTPFMIGKIEPNPFENVTDKQLSQLLRIMNVDGVRSRSGLEPADGAYEFFCEVGLEEFLKTPESRYTMQLVINEICKRFAFKP